jgi:hypothetical protein
MLPLIQCQFLAPLSRLAPLLRKKVLLSVTAVCLLVDKRDPKLLQQEACKGAETDSRTKLGKETIAEIYRRPKWVPYYGPQADSGSVQALLRHAHPRLRYAQALLRHAHPRLRYAQALLRHAHPRLRLKQQLLTSAD